jgi:hypothetical protein
MPLRTTDGRLLFGEEHSHEDYLVTIGADFISFASDAPTKQEKEPFVSGYRIKSEKEVRKK